LSAVKGVEAQDSGAAATELVAGGGRRGRALAPARYGGEGGRLEGVGEIGNQINLNSSIPSSTSLYGPLRPAANPNKLPNLLLQPNLSLEISHYRLAECRRRSWRSGSGGYSGGPT
jgi:hypothetical protein